MDSVLRKEKIILGIDPGTRILGFGVIRVLGGRAEYVEMGVVNLTGEKEHFPTLKKILHEVLAIIEKYRPDEMAIEAPFYGKNPQVLLKLGRAQGAAISAALMRDIPISEYPPRSVKLSVTGKGAASKEQVGTMVQNLLKIDVPQKYPDATDALAIAMCHYYHSTSPLQSLKKHSGWGDFIKNNPDRIINVTAKKSQ